VKSHQNRGLGRGLSALLGDVEESGEAAPAKAQTAVAIDLIRPNPAQPRRRFEEAEIAELAESIRERGVIQPLILRPEPGGEGFQIVAGERRWRAAQKAQLHEVPAVVRELDDATVLEFAIIENVQRADLTPVEESRGYARLMEEFGHTQEKLAEVVGKSRSYIANALRLLTLPEEVLEMPRRIRWRWPVRWWPKGCPCAGPKRWPAPRNAPGAGRRPPGPRAAPRRTRTPGPWNQTSRPISA
jgi:ParB family chromosome partitioning protein